MGRGGSVEEEVEVEEAVVMEEAAAVASSHCVSRCKQDDAELFSRQLNMFYV